MRSTSFFSLAMVAALCAFTGIACQSSAAHSSSTTTSNIMSNKEKAVALLRSIETGDPGPATNYVNPNHYTQHNLGAADGIQGFGALLQQLPPNSAKVKVVRAFEDGNYVFAHTEYNFFGPKIGFDIFRFEDGKIVEHWDNLQETVTETKSGRSMTDGPAQATDLGSTEANKKIITDFIADILIGGKSEKITQYISTEKYHQHNPGVADGLDGLGAALEGLAKAGMPMTYSKNYRILGEGDFVLAQSEGQFLNKHVAFYDLFRLENGKITEHWDVIEPIPARADWKNENGKF